MKYSYLNASPENIEKWLSRELIYIGEDEQIYCKKCNACLTMQIRNFYFVRQCVECDGFKSVRQELKDIEESKRQDKIKEMKKQCFPTKKAMESTFKAGNTNSLGTYDVIKYCNRFAEYRRDGMGLLLYGDVGVGKTYLANAVAHKLIESGYRCLSTNFSRLYDESCTQRNKQGYIDDLRKYHLIVIDDLGTERKSPVMLDFAYKVVNTLYENEIPVVFTTNLSISTMKNQATGIDSDLCRIYSRIINTTIPIEIKCRRGEVYEANLTQREAEGFMLGLKWEKGKSGALQ